MFEIKRLISEKWILCVNRIIGIKGKQFHDKHIFFQNEWNNIRERWPKFACVLL